MTVTSRPAELTLKDMFQDLELKTIPSFFLLNIFFIFSLLVLLMKW